MRGRNRPNLTWEQVGRMNMTGRGIERALVGDRRVWKAAILRHDPDPGVIRV